MLFRDWRYIDWRMKYIKQIGVTRFPRTIPSIHCSWMKKFEKICFCLSIRYRFFNLNVDVQMLPCLLFKQVVVLVYSETGVTDITQKRQKSGSILMPVFDFNCLQKTTRCVRTVKCKKLVWIILASCSPEVLKGYLRNKTIISENLLSEALVKIFYFFEKLWSVLMIFKFLYF